MLIDGALEVVQELRAQYRMAIVTNGLSLVQRRRFERSPSATASPRSSFRRIGTAKPAAEYFDATFARWETRPRRRFS